MIDVASNNIDRLIDHVFRHEVIAGYNHAFANNLEEAVAIAKNNPVFELTESRILVRPVKHLEGIN